jgi:hypothetical protein
MGRRKRAAPDCSETRGWFECYGNVMKLMPTGPRAARALSLRPLAALVCAVAVPWLALSPAAMGGTATASAPAAEATATAAGGNLAGAALPGGQTTLPSSKTIASAILEQCATATIPQTERAATFAGEMAAIAGTARMEIRIDLEERGPEELLFHTVSASGLGVWHSSAAGVKIFTHIQQVTNLSAPALYRGVLRFRWLNDKSRPIKTEELHTARCEQPAPSAATTTPTGTTTTTTTTTTTATTSPTGTSSPQG